MTKRPPGPAIRKALGFLSANIDRGEWPQGEKLPSLQALAQAVGVSRSSVWKAVGELKRNGLLSVVEGGKILMGGAIHESKVPFNETGKSWEKRRALFAQDIINGRYAGRETLPSLAELQARYSVCYATLKKMLDSLEKTGLLKPHKKSYTIPVAKKHRFQSTIIMFSPTGVFPLYDEHNRKLIDTLENECALAGLTITFIDLDMRAPDKNTRIIRSLHGDESVIGYLFNLSWTGYVYGLQEVKRLLNLLAAHKKPLAILDHIGGFAVALLPPGDTVHLFRPANKRAGETVARLLLKHGHRHIAYMSFFWHEQAWSQERLSGLQHMFRTAGFDKNIRCFFGGVALNDDGPLLSVLPIDEKTLEKMFRPGRTEYEYQRTLLRYQHYRTQAFFPDSLPKDIQTPVSDFIALKKVLGTMSIQSFSLIRQALYDSTVTAVGRAYMGRFFQKALGNRNITAWVCSHDEHVLGVQAFLKQQGKRIPQDISIVSFGNSIRTFENNITSYDFGMQTIAHRMLRYVLHPSGENGRGPTEIEGALIERGSTGKAQGGG
jgi:DNA-binding LacI/PurR family transcriptional regulator/DNA-binding transcriptional regulator YhcF (GntR family)